MTIPRRNSRRRRAFPRLSVSAPQPTAASPSRRIRCQISATPTNTSHYWRRARPFSRSIPGGTFGYLWRASWPAPGTVAGSWALMKSKRPSASVTEILNALAETGTSITDPRSGLAFPRINVDAALATLPASCGYTVSPGRLPNGPDAGTVAIAVTTTANCSWVSRRAHRPSWSFRSSPAGSGSGDRRAVVFCESVDRQPETASSRSRVAR